jgi:hypothetical protein
MQSLTANNDAFPRDTYLFCLVWQYHPDVLFTISGTDYEYACELAEHLRAGHHAQPCIVLDNVDRPF